jgi:hypothetical protein
MDFDEFLRVLAALERERVDYLLVGGAAVNLHGIVRMTEDVDLFVRPTRENLMSLLAALRSVWQDPELDELAPEDLLGDYPTLRYGPPDGGMVIDVLTRIGSKFRFEDLEGETVELDGVRIRVATPLTLIRMKQGTLRPGDQADAEALRKKFGLPREG